jgi:hypothetical protein
MIRMGPVLLEALTAALLTTSAEGYDTSAKHVVSACRTWLAEGKKETSGT